MKILVFTTDMLPLEGFPTSGTALRTFGIVQGLRSLGHEVVVSVPRSAVEGTKKRLNMSTLSPDARRVFNSYSALAFDGANQNRIIAECGPDVIICGHWPAMTLSTKPSQALIIDLAGPHMLERHYQGSPNQAGALLGKLTALGRADYYIVSGPTQRLYFLSFLLRAQIEQAERRIIELTMPLPPQAPKNKANAEDAISASDYPQFVFGGVFLPWQDPTAALTALSRELEKRKRGSLTLIGGPHPSYKMRQGIYDSLFASLEKNPRVSTHPMLPYADFIDALAEKNVALDLMSWNLERELAVTIRSTSYLWAGLPIIYNDFADLSKLIGKYDAGWCVNPDDAQALQAVLAEIFDNPSLVIKKSQNAARLAREVFSWDKAVEPLLKFLGAPEIKHAHETDLIYDFPDSAELPIHKSASLDQRFLCRLHGLSRVEIRIATHNRKIKKPLSLALHKLEGAETRDGRLLTEGRPTLIKELEITADSLKNNEWCALDFSPLPDSAGSAYSLKITAEEISPENSVSPWAVKGCPYPLLEMRYQDKRVAQTSICMRTTCSGGLLPVE